MVKNEIWLPIPNFDGYEISNYGRMRSWKPYRNYGKIPIKPRMMNFALDKDGYCKVYLYQNGKVRYFRVHQLVLEIFVSAKPPFPNNKALHRNDIKTDNKVDNLYWGSCKDNSKDAKNNGTWNHGTKVNTCKLNEDKVRYIKNSDKSHTELAKELNVTVGTIWHIKNGRTWKHVS